MLSSGTYRLEANIVEQLSPYSANCLSGCGKGLSFMLLPSQLFVCVLRYTKLLHGILIYPLVKLLISVK